GSLVPRLQAGDKKGQRKTAQHTQTRGQRAERQAPPKDGRIERIKSQRPEAEQPCVVPKRERPLHLAVGAARLETHEPHRQQRQEQEDQEPQQSGTAGEGGTEEMSPTRELLAGSNF